ncbi:MAG: triple tyrosine motif-containing protein, partial [Saprospiraceae bacterium]|nr:triple tyrosine motif-containing protein [Saprospiraceae bacterium]
MFVGDGLLEANLKTGHIVTHRYQATEDPTVYDSIFASLALAADTGIWIGSDQGLLYYSRATQEIHKVETRDIQLSELMRRRIGSIEIEPKGTLVFTSGRNNLVRWDPGNGFWEQLLGSARAGVRILNKACITPDGEIWLAFEHELGLLTPEGDLFIVPNRTGSPRGLNPDVINDMDTDQSGNAWIATNGAGISRVEKSDSGAFSFQYYTTVDGLPNDIVFHLRVGNDGDIWVNTQVGIAVVAPETHQVRSFNTIAEQLYQLSSGEILGGAIGRIYYAHADSLRKAPPAPRPYIYRVETADSTILLPFTEPTQIRIGPTETSFSVEWGALAFDDHPNTRFAYMLEGFDVDWVFADRTTMVRYNRLSPGNYAFRLKAVSAAGTWSDDIRIPDIQVVALFTRTIWFYVLVGLIIAALLYTFYR